MNKPPKNLKRDILLSEKLNIILNYISRGYHPISVSNERKNHSITYKKYKHPEWYTQYLTELPNGSLLIRNNENRSDEIAKNNKSLYITITKSITFDKNVIDSIDPFINGDINMDYFRLNYFGKLIVNFETEYTWNESLNNNDINELVTKIKYVEQMIDKLKSMFALIFIDIIEPKKINININKFYESKGYFEYILGNEILSKTVNPDLIIEPKIMLHNIFNQNIKIQSEFEGIGNYHVNSYKTNNNNDIRILIEIFGMELEYDYNKDKNNNRTSIFKMWLAILEHFGCYNRFLNDLQYYLLEAV